MKGKRYNKLKPTETEYGIWVIGERMERYNPMASQIDKPQALLPLNHAYTRLLMKEAHCKSGHRGRDASLAWFRQHYWVSQGAKAIKSTVVSCQLCKRRAPTLLNQRMGQLPMARLKLSPPFTNVMVDFFGPFFVRGEVQKRTTGKAYRVILTDLGSRAVHIEGCFGYDTGSFLLSLKRFVSIRGWPSHIYSDQESQVIAANKELKTMWKSIDKARINKTSATSGTKWHFGPADSPWNQGAVESLVKSAKRGFKLCMGEKRVSPCEFMTICYDVANMMNERPLGVFPSQDSDINVLTPNMLLLGRATADTVIDRHHGTDSTQARYELVSSITQKFWEKWKELYAPSLVTQSKWQKTKPNLQVGYVLLVCDSNSLRSQYHIAQVQEVYPDEKGIVRRVSLRYKNFKTRENVHTYSGAPDVTD